MFGRKDEQPEHEITKSWRPGQITDDYIQKLHKATCTCGWVSPEGNFHQLLMTVGAHEAAVEQVQAAAGVAV
jgi:hypothetical protein